MTPKATTAGAVDGHGALHDLKPRSATPSKLPEFFFFPSFKETKCPYFRQVCGYFVSSNLKKNRKSLQFRMGSTPG